MSGKRAALDPQVVIRDSREIANKLYAVDAFKTCRHVLFYLSLEKEAQTGEMIERAFELGKKVYVPIVDRERHILQITKLPRLDIEFETGAYGIREPGRKRREIVSPEILEFVVAPGIVFDLKGGRIGFGGGYYDRLLSGLSQQATCVGVAFDFQVLESIPQTKNDVRVHKIITEKQTITC